MEKNRWVTALQIFWPEGEIEGFFSTADHKIDKAVTYHSVRNFSLQVSAETFISPKAKH
jgi:hypothetical protein